MKRREQENSGWRVSGTQGSGQPNTTIDVDTLVAQLTGQLTEKLAKICSDKGNKQAVISAGVIPTTTFFVMMSLLMVLLLMLMTSVIFP